MKNIAKWKGLARLCEELSNSCKDKRAGIKIRALIYLKDRLEAELDCLAHRGERFPVEASYIPMARRLIVKIARGEK